MLKKPSILDVATKMHYREKSFEDLQYVLECLADETKKHVDVNALISIDYLMSRGGSKLSVKCLKHIRSVFEFKDMENSDEVSYTRKHKIAHKKYKLMTPEKLFDLALKDKDLRAYLLKEYSLFADDLGNTVFDISVFNSYTLLLSYCTLVDVINDTNLCFSIENLIHELKHNNYNKANIVKQVKQTINEFFN